jgi:hypothetical protein
MGRVDHRAGIILESEPEKLTGMPSRGVLHLKLA